MKKRKPVFIKRRCLETITRWSLISSPKKEITFLGAGRKNVVSHVVRLQNIANKPRSFFLWNMNEHRFVMKELKHMGLKCLITGHSHPGGPDHPSRIDWQWMDIGHREIVASVRGEQVNISAWQIREKYYKTVEKGQLKLIVK